MAGGCLEDTVSAESSNRPQGLLARMKKIKPFLITAAVALIAVAVAIRIPVVKKAIFGAA